MIVFEKSYSDTLKLLNGDDVWCVMFYVEVMVIFLYLCVYLLFLATIYASSGIEEPRLLFWQFLQPESQPTDAICVFYFVIFLPLHYNDIDETLA